MIIIGVLLIVAVVLDGYRRVRSERSGRIRVTLSKQARVRGMNSPAVEEPVDPLASNPELPNGGARVIVKARREDINLHESVPVLMESVHLAPDASASEITKPATNPITQTEVAELTPEGASEFAAEPVLSDVIEEVDEVELAPAAAPVPVPAKAPTKASTKVPTSPVAACGADKSLPPIKSSELYISAIDNEDNNSAAANTTSSLWGSVEPEAVEKSVSAPVKSAAKSAPESASRRSAKQPELSSSAQDVIIVNVLSKDAGGFKGQDVLQILLACDMRFGDMNIFHRHENANGKGPIQFSVANLVEPGTFNLDAIDHFSTPGVCFFLTLPGPEKSITAFNYMVETAQVLVKNLHGELRDDAHSVMTQQTIEHCRQRIRDFERKQLTLHL